MTGTRFKFNIPTFQTFLNSVFYPNLRVQEKRYMRTKKPSQLMKQMGSRTGQFDPEPPDQWLYVLRHGRGEEQAIAWIKSKTIAIGHDSPFAIDEDSRKPLKSDA